MNANSTPLDLTVPETPACRPSRALRLGAASAAALCAITTAGCTSLYSTPVPSGSAISSGFTYRLPKLAYDIEITRVLTQCPDANAPHPEFTISGVSAAAVFGGEPVRIDYERLSSWNKTTDLSIEEYPDQTLKSVNAEVDDQTAAIAAQTVASGVSIAKMIIGVPPLGALLRPLPPNQNEPPLALACSPQATGLLKVITAERKAAASAATAAESTAAALANFEADHPEALRSDATNQEVASLFAQAGQTQRRADAASKALAASIAKVTLVSRLHVDPGVTPQVINSLDDATGGAVKPDDLFQFRVGVDPTALLRAESHVAVVVRTLDDTPAPDPKSLSACSSKACGVLYRAGAPARLRICKIVTAPAPFERRPGDDCWSRLAGDETIVLSDDRNIPQLGPIASLPLHNGVFANNILNASFAEDGTLLKFEYKQPTAPGAVAAGALNNMVNGAQSVLDYEAGKPLRESQNAKAIADARSAAQTAAHSIKTPAIIRAEAEQALADAQAKAVQSQIDLKTKQAELEALGARPDITP